MSSNSLQIDFSTAPIYTVLAVDSVRRLCLVTNTQNSKEWLPVASPTGFKGEGDFSLPPSGAGWRAFVETRLGQREIVQFLSPGSFFSEDNEIANSLESGGTKPDTWNSITGTSATFRSYAVPPDTVKRNFRGNRYYDLVGGDWGYRGQDGNFVGVLRGGVNVFIASPLCGWYMFQEDDHARLVSRNFEMFSDFGVIQSTNVNGRTRLAIKGVSGLNDKTSSREENYEFELELGDCKNIEANTFNMTLLMKTGAGEPVRIGLKRADGSLYVNTPGDVMTDIGGMWGNAVAQRHAVFAGTESRHEVGDMSMVVTKGKVSGGKETQVKNIVQKPHLDLYNDALQHMVKALIPLIAFGAPPNEVFGILNKLDFVNATKDAYFS